MGQPASRAILRVSPGPDNSLRSEKILELSSQGSARIGSATTCEIRFEDVGLAKVHAFLEWSPAEVRILSRPETGGLRVNGVEMERRVLRSGDRVELGDTVLLYKAQAPDSLEGTQLGGYFIEERLGRGGMGTVYRARQLSLDRIVALKILSPRLTRNRDFIKGFLREARAAAKLNHPNVVQIYDAMQQGDTFFFSMEYVSGGSLAECLETEGKLTLARALEVTRDVAQALAWAADRGIVHRDIKPDNLLLAEDGTVKVADLGIATRRGAATAQDAAEGGKFVPGLGTPRYVAPEQALGKAVDHRADVYGLGCTLYRMLSGRVPFEGDSAKEILRAKLRRDPVPLHAQLSGIPRSVSDLVQKSLARDPDERISSPRELLRALEKITVPGARGRRGRRPSSSRAAQRRRSAGRRSLFVVVVLMFLLALVALALWRRQQETQGESEVGTRAVVDPRTDGAERVAIGLEPVPPPEFDEVPAAEPAPSEPSASESELPNAAGGVAVGDAGGARSNPVPVQLERVAGGQPERSKGAGGGESTPVPQVSRIPKLPKGEGRVPQLVTVEVTDTVKQWQAGRLSSSSALEKLQALKVRAPEPFVRSGGEKALETVKNRRSIEIRKELSSVLEKEVEPLLERWAFRQAELRLEEIEKKFPDAQDIFVQRRAELVRRARAVVGEVSEQAERQAARGDFSSAMDSLARLAESLPAAAVTERDGLRARVESETAVLRREGTEFQRLQRRIGEWMEIGSFIRVRRALAEHAAPVSSGGLARAALTGWPRRLRRELEVCERSWKRLVSGVRAAVRGRQEFRLRFQLDGTAHVLAKYDRGSVTVTDRRGTKERRPLLHVATRDLLQIWRMGSRRTPAEEELRAGVRGIALLLLYTQRPGVAGAVLRYGVASPDELADLRERAESEERPYLAEGLREAARRKLELEGRAAVSGSSAEKRRRAEWDELADDLKPYLGVARQRDVHVEAAAEFARAFVHARVSAARIGGPGQLFHGVLRRFEGGVLEIHYNFLNPVEARDWVPVGRGTRVAVEAEGGGRLRLRGEVRLGHGSPFRDRLAVSGNVTSGAYDELRPNLNVGLWTRSGTGITPRADERRKTWDGSPPAQYLAFCIGFQPPFRGPNAAAEDLLLVRGRGVLVRMPANAILGGTDDSSLLPYSRSACLWARSAKFAPGGFSFEVAMARAQAHWVVDGKRLLEDPPPKLLTTLPAGGLRGSVTLFTAGAGVKLDSLTVEGDLDPVWFEARLAARAEGELKALRKHGEESGMSPR